MIDRKDAKFLFRFNNNMLPDYLKNYFVKLETVYYYHTRQKTKNIFFTLLLAQNEGERCFIVKNEMYGKRYLCN